MSTPVGVTSARDSKGARTRARIVESAASEFAEHGYGGASLRNIAAAAGIQVGALYFHFESKDELISAVLAESVESARAALVQAVDEVTATALPAERVYAAIAGHLHALHASEDRAASIVRMVETLPPDLRLTHAKHERRFARVWTDILRRGQAEGAVRTDIPLRLLRDILIGALNSTATRNPAAIKDLDALAGAIGQIIGLPRRPS